MSKPIKTSRVSSNNSILGVFDGICADATVINENNLKIGKDVWVELFNSEEYQTGLDLGHYIGFLGHPEDPGCQDFKQACIVMTSCELLPDGTLHGTFNLIDTPVGRIVKSFIDAGVTFGISVRGCGDIVSDEVVAGTFVFRGFDLVTFPAYTNAIPEFQEIAASSNVEKRQKYIAARNTLETNLKHINSVSTLNHLKTPFGASSDVASAIDNRISEIEKCSEEGERSTPESGELVCNEADILSTKLEAMTDLFMSTSLKCQNLESEIAGLKRSYHESVLANQRKISSMQRISTQQIDDLSKSLESSRIEASRSLRKVKSLEATVSDLTQDLKSQKIVASKHLDTIKQLEAQLASSERNASRNRIVASKNKQALTDHQQDLAEYQEKVAKLQDENLKYRQKVEASRDTIRQQKSTIAGLNRQLSETVANAKRSASSNCDAEVSELREQIASATTLIKEYQDAYATLYATATGADLEHITVTASTTVDQLKQSITGESSAMNVSDVFVDPQPVDVEDTYDAGLDGLVTC